MTTIPGVLEEIRYRRAGRHRGPYKHPFQTPAAIRLKRSGGLDIEPLTPGQRLWSRDAAGEVWLDNPTRKRRTTMARRRHHHRHHRHHHRHNPYLAAYNPGFATSIQHAFSAHALETVAGGGLGVAGTYLGYKTVFAFSGTIPLLAQYAAGTDWLSILVRFGVRSAVAIGTDMLADKFLPVGMRQAYRGGAAGYVGAATVLEALGYQITIGQGLPLVSILPAGLQPTTAVAGWENADMGAYVRRPTAGARVPALSMGAFVPGSAAGRRAGVDGIYVNRMTPGYQTQIRRG